MNNQLIPPTEYEALPVERRECYKQVWQLLNGHSQQWINASSQPDTCEDTFDEWCYGYMQPIPTRLMYAPIIPIKEELTVTRFTMSEDLILKKNDVVAAVFCDSALATEVINYLNTK